jgi:MFS family permease
MAHIVAIAVFIPWLPFCIYQLSVVQAFGFWIPPVTPDTMVNFMTNVIYYKDVGQVNGWFALGLVGIIVLLSWLALKIHKSQNNKQKQNYRLIIAVAFIPSIIMFLFSMPPLRSLFVDRYLVPSVPLIAIFIGTTLSIGADFIKAKWQILAIAIITSFMIVGVGNVWYYGNYSKTSNASNNTRDIFNDVSAKSGVGEPIIADSPWLFYEASFYSNDQHPVYFIDANTSYGFGSLDMLKYNDQSKIKDIKQFTADHPIVWYMGLPRGASFSAPYSNWQSLQTIETNDTINGKPSYKAIQYQIVN